MSEKFTIKEIELIRFALEYLDSELAGWLDSCSQDGSNGVQKAGTILRGRRSFPLQASRGAQS